MFYGANCTSADPTYVDTVFHSIYYRALPALGVNRHITITLGFRTLPHRFQGLGLREPNLVVLSAKIGLLHLYFGQQHNSVSSVVSCSGYFSWIAGCLAMFLSWIAIPTATASWHNTAGGLTYKGSYLSIR